MNNNMDLKRLKKQNKILNLVLTVLVFLIYISIILVTIQAKRVYIEMIDDSCETCEDIFHATCVGEWADTLEELNEIIRKNERSALSSVGWGLPPGGEDILENTTINIALL